MRVRLILPLVLVAALAVLAGCGSGGTPAAAKAGAADRAVPAALRFTGTTLDGKPFDGASLAGRPALLWFWAPWCATCAGEAPTVSAEADRFKGRVGVVGVAGMGPVNDMHRFVTEEEVGNFPSLSDNTGVVWKRFGITQQSLYVLIDRHGNVVMKGWLDSLQLPQQLAKLAAA